MTLQCFAVQEDLIKSSDDVTYDFQPFPCKKLVHTNLKSLRCNINVVISVWVDYMFAAGHTLNAWHFQSLCEMDTESC